MGDTEMTTGALVGRACRILALAFAAMVPLSFFSGNAQTIDEITQRGKVVIGVQADFPPFAFVNENQQPDGLNVDFARLIGKYMGVDVEIVQVESANRIPYLVTGQVDLLVASLGVTPERARQVMFTIPYAGTTTEIIAPKSTQIHSLSDLSGKRIAAGRASSNDMFVTELAPPDAIIMRYEGEAAAAQALLSGQVDALAFSNTMTKEIMEGNPQAELEAKLGLRSQYDALAVRKDAFELREWLNATIYYVKETGELGKLYQKWVGSPLPELPTF